MEAPRATSEFEKRVAASPSDALIPRRHENGTPIPIGHRFDPSDRMAFRNMALRTYQRQHACLSLLRSLHHCPPVNNFGQINMENTLERMKNLTNTSFQQPAI